MRGAKFGCGEIEIDHQVNFSFKNIVPASIAIPKLKSVPISTYSVSFLSFDSFRSPKRKTDFAARRNPIASHWPASTNVNTKSLSNIPM